MKRIISIVTILFATYTSFGQCSPSFTPSFTPTSNSLLNYTFLNTTVITPPTGYSAHYLFNYGDGTSDYSGQHNYAAIGTYTVTMAMNVTDTTRTIYCYNNTTKTINVTYTPCETTITYSVTTENNTQKTVNFIATTPVGTSGMIYSWDFDNTNGSGANIAHTYTVNGNYLIRLTAIGGGCAYTNNIQISVNGHECNGYHRDGIFN